MRFQSLDRSRRFWRFVEIVVGHWAIGLLVVVMDIGLSDQAMVLDSMGLGEEVSQVFNTCSPEDFELAVSDAVLNPVVAHGG